MIFRANVFKLRLTQWQDCRLFGDEKEDSGHTVCHWLALVCKIYRTLYHMFLKTKDLENVRVNGLIRVVANTRLPCSYTVPFLLHIHSTGLYLGSLPPVVCCSTQTRPFPIPPPSDWFRLFSNHTFSHINTPTMSFWLFFLLTMSSTFFQVYYWPYHQCCIIWTVNNRIK
jgi:hypothetical protein